MDEEVKPNRCTYHVEILRLVSPRSEHRITIDRAARVFSTLPGILATQRKCRERHASARRDLLGRNENWLGEHQRSEQLWPFVCCRQQSCRADRGAYPENAPRARCFSSRMKGKGCSALAAQRQEVEKELQQIAREVVVIDCTRALVRVTSDGICA